MSNHRRYLPLRSEDQTPDGMQGVPGGIVNETHHFEGAVSEEVYVDEIVKMALEKQSKSTNWLFATRTRK